MGFEPTTTGTTTLRSATELQPPWLMRTGGRNRTPDKWFGSICVTSTLHLQAPVFPGCHQCNESSRRDLNPRPDGRVSWIRTRDLYFPKVAGTTKLPQYTLVI